MRVLLNRKETKLDRFASLKIKSTIKKWLSNTVQMEGTG